MWPYMNLLGSQFCHLTDSFYSLLKGYSTIWPYNCVGTCVWKMWWRQGGMGRATRPSSRVLGALIQSLDISLYITNKKEQRDPDYAMVKIHCSSHSPVRSCRHSWTPNTCSPHVLPLLALSSIFIQGYEHLLFIRNVLDTLCALYYLL